MDIYCAEKIAQDRMSNASGGEWDKKFCLVGNGGALSCEWLDPFLGMFTIEGKEGFLMTKHVPADVDVLMPEENAKSNDH